MTGRVAQAVQKMKLLDRVTTIGPIQALGQGARNRFVVTPEQLQIQSPFVLLVEDFLDADAQFEMHPHRGIETVTLILEGQLEHADHLRNSGTLGPGDIQWMTAGRGILHGGKPARAEGVRALQLWVNLPAALKGSPPGTREQRRQQASLRASSRGEVFVYGDASRPAHAEPWSCWPVSVMDVRLSVHGTAEIEIPARNRVFVYVLFGEVRIGTSAEPLVAGQVGWLNQFVEDQARLIPIRSPVGTRAVIYAAPSFSEPVVAHGPFVMNTLEEIREAYAQLRAGTFLSD